MGVEKEIERLIQMRVKKSKKGKEIEGGEGTGYRDI